MGTHPIFESDFDCLTDKKMNHQMPHRNMGGQFGGHGQQQAKQSSGTGFSLMNIVPVYTLLVVGYAIYIWFKVKSRKNEDSTDSKTKAKKSEIDELKERLARTEEALNKLVAATTQLQKNMPEEEIARMFGIDNLGKEEESPLKENKPENTSKEESPAKESKLEDVPKEEEEAGEVEQ